MEKKDKYLPKTRISARERIEYDQACEADGKQVTEKLRELAVGYTKKSKAKKAKK